MAAWARRVEMGKIWQSLPSRKAPSSPIGWNLPEICCTQRTTIHLVCLTSHHVLQAVRLPAEAEAEDGHWCCLVPDPTSPKDSRSATHRLRYKKSPDRCSFGAEGRAARHIDCLGEFERAAGRQDEDIQELQQRSAQYYHLLTMQPKLEDLDNRGCWRNLRIRGILELVEHDQIPLALQSLVNNLLERPQGSSVKIWVSSQSSATQGREGDPHRDIIHCFMDFKLKEEVAICTLDQDKNYLQCRGKSFPRPLSNCLK